MRYARTIILYLLAVIAVVALGGLAGWYLFLRGQSQATLNADAARGFDSSAPVAAPIGSSFQGGVPDTGTAGAGSATLPQLWRVDAAPVAGFAFMGQGTSTRLLFVERSTGYVLAADPRAQSVTRLTNTLMPKIHEAYFATGGRVVERAVDDSGNITTFAGHFTANPATSSPSTLPGALSGTYLDQNITALALQPESGALFMLERRGVSFEGYTMDWGGDKHSVFSTAIADWRPTWLSDGRLVLLEKPADDVPGYAYELRGGSLVPIARGAPGLTVLPQASSTALLYGISTGSGIALYAQTSASAVPQALSARTVADKCAWAAGTDLIAYCAVPQATYTGNFLDDWYKGLAHTSDAWWRVDASAGTAEAVYAPRDRSFDVRDPTVDTSGLYIAFQDGRDGSLWLLRTQN